MVGSFGPAPPPGGRGDLRLVVNLVGDAAHGQLAESRFVERTFLPGGEHNMYELAFAAAASGYEVELRGWIERQAFDRLRHALGIAPRVQLAPRRPANVDLVVVPEGWQDPLEYARLLLSPARLAIFLLAAPGLFGWPFTGPGWIRPDPVTVPVDSVARPDHFRAMQALDFELLSHSPGIVAAAEAAGVPCTFVGTGRPVLPRAQCQGERANDVAAILANRWEPLVRAVARELPELTLDLIEESPNREVLERLSQARVLLWPSRIEGHATIPWEARSVGCVPVALASNRFAVGLNEEAGAVVVDEVEALGPAIRALLADPVRWSELSARAQQHARREVDWEGYAGRVGSFLERPARSSPEGRAARGAMGAAWVAWEGARAEQAQAAFEDMAAHAEALDADRGRVLADRERVRADFARLQMDCARLHEEHEHLASSLAALKDRRSVRAALRIADVKKRLSGDGVTARSARPPEEGGSPGG